MKNQIKYLLLSGCITCTFSSCADFLDINPTDSFTEVAVWNDLNLAETYLNQQYNHTFSEFQKSVMYANYSDEAYHMHGYGVTEVVQGLLSPDKPNLAWNDDMYNNPWKLNYSFIKEINMFMEKIPSVPASTEENIKWKNELIGQGYFFRAWYYSELYRHYGSVPLIIHTFGLHDNYSDVLRAPVDDVMEYIVSQCDSASVLLPVKYNDDSNFGRATKGAALALKARTLLFGASPLYGTPSEAKWKRAAEANKAVIDLKDENSAPAYYLPSFNNAEEYAQSFTDKNNPEAIFMKLFSKEGGAIGNSSFTHLAPCGPGSGFESWGTIQPSQKIVDEFEMENGGKYIIGKETENPYLHREWRFYASIFYDGATWGYGPSSRKVELYVSGEEGVTGGLDSREGPNWWNGPQTGYNIRKFLDTNYDTYGTDANETPWFFFRLSEFYLNYAECMIGLGNTAEAAQYINLIRSRVHLPAITPDGIWKKYEHERMVELIFEGQRWFDLRRWKTAEVILSQNIYGIDVKKYKDGSKKYIRKTEPTQTRSFVAPQNYWLPIPRAELQKAPQLDPAPYK